MSTRNQERHYENMLKLYGEQVRSADPKVSSYAKLKVAEYSERLRRVRVLRTKLVTSLGRAA